ncbi:nsp1a [Passerine astrovirus 4]|nr:nsp1a [Passerine astrovirus 4]
MASAFSEATKRAKRVQQRTMAGLAKLVPGAGTETLLNTMKGYYGTSQNWKRLMNFDAVLLKDIKHAYAYDQGTFWEFVAKRNPEKGGWDISLHQQENILQEHKNALVAHASLEERVRASGALASARAERILRLEERVNTLENIICSQESKLSHYQKEITLLREHIREMSITKEAAITVAKTTTFSMKSMILGILVVILAFFLRPADAADCTREVVGCYLVDGPGTPMQFFEFSNVCFGATRTILKTGQVKKELLSQGCIEDMTRVFGKVEWAATWCNTTIENRLHYVVCDKVDFYQEIEAQIMTTYTFLKTMDWTSPVLENIAHLVSLLMIFFATKPIHTFVLYVLGYLLSVPPFCLAIAITIFPPFTFGFLMIAMFFPLSFSPQIIGVFSAHWIVGTLHSFATSEQPLQAVSTHLFHSLCSPLWFVVTRIIQFYRIQTSCQILLFVAGLTWTIGLRFLNSLVVVTAADGTVKKYKRIELVKDSLKGTLLKVQNAVRGVVPAIPDKTENIVLIETSLGTGVGFRFMNQILTIGHLVGADKTVRVTWKNISCITTVHDRIPLFESADELVRLKIPSEMQGLKPLRLTRDPKTDYMAMPTFDPQGQLANFMGWCIVDGNWLSSTFETHAGTSGSPYVDRHGRLVAIHLGTQGVIAQGYILYETLHGRLPLIEAQQHIVDKSECVQIQNAGILPSKLADEITERVLEKLIDGTRKSHAVITSQLEQLMNENIHLKKLLDVMEQRLNEQNYRLMNLEAPFLELEKKKGKNKPYKRGGKTKSRFMKMKVLTEEQYKKMLEEGWTAEEIKDAVDQLREAAWLAYEEEQDDWDEQEMEDRLRGELNDFLSTQSTHSIENGKKTQTLTQVIVEQAKKSMKKAFCCKFCNKEFNKFHDIKKCRESQRKSSKGGKKKQEEPQEPKNLEKGKKEASP